MFLLPYILYGEMNNPNNACILVFDVQEYLELISISIYLLIYIYIYMACTNFFHIFLDRIHDFLTACTTYIFAKGQKIIPLLSRHVRCLLNSFDIEHVTLRPFKPLQEAASAQKYARVLHSFLVFLLESYPYQVTRGPRDRDLNRLYAIDHMVKAGIQELKDLLLSPTLAEEDEEAPKASGPLQAGSARAYIGDDLDGENDEEDEIDLALDLGGDDGEEDLEDSGVLEKLERQAWQATSGFQFTQAAVHEGVALIEKLLIDLVTRHESYDMKGPIYAFLACFSIHYQEVTFKRIDRISQSYSAVIYAMQLVAINHHWTPWIRRILEAKEDGQDQALANAAPFHAVFGPWLQTYFKHQSPYPLGDLLSFRAYALYYNTISSVQGNQVIEQAPHHLRFHHLSVSRLQLQEFFQKSTLDLAHSLVGSLLIWEDAQLFNQIQLGEAARFEDFAMEGNGFNFLTLNEDYQHHYQPYLVKKILDDPTRAKEWFKPVSISRISSIWLNGIHILIYIYIKYHIGWKSAPSHSPTSRAIFIYGQEVPAPSACSGAHDQWRPCPRH